MVSDDCCSPKTFKMTKDTKILIGSIVFTAVLIVGFAFWQSSIKDDEPSATSAKVEGLVADHDYLDFGQVPINGGIVTKTYQVKNTTSNSLKLKKIVTSCMCTTAAVSIGDKTTNFFGMEMPGDKNPPVNIDLPAGDIANVTVKFDPAAHGPQGIGPFDRSVWLTFTDPAGVKELKFSGTVIN